MSRTPSMSRIEAEQMLGPRGNLRVTLENRSLVRKWLVASCVRSAFVGGLSMESLQSAYNDTTDEALRMLHADSLATPDESEDDSAPVPAPAVPAPETPVPAAANGHDKSADAALSMVNALRDLIASTASKAVDADAVREIMRAELPSLIPVQRIELTINGQTRDLGTKARHKVFPRVLKAIARGHAVALVGPAGSGKTTIAEQVAEALGTEFYMNGAIGGAHEYLGFTDAYGKYHSTPFRQAFEHGGLWLGDECDASDPAAVLIINSALANGHMPFPDTPTPIKRHPDFRVIITANTYGTGADRIYVGRNQLDGATLDRFRFVEVQYDETLERQLCGNDAWCDRVQALRAAAAAEKARIIISPRASIMGAAALADGELQSDVERDYVWKGTDAELQRRIVTRVGS